MQNGIALQAGTSHDLGQNFGKAFDVQFQSKEGGCNYVWQTSWGVSTRLIGGLIILIQTTKGWCCLRKWLPSNAVMVPIYPQRKEQSAGTKLQTKIAEGVWTPRSTPAIGVSGCEVFPLGAARHSRGV